MPSHAQRMATHPRAPLASHRPIGARERLLHRTAREHVRHGQYHKRDCEEKTDPEPPGHVDQFEVDLLLHTHRARFERHATDRTTPWLVADNLWVHRTGIRGADH